MNTAIQQTYDELLKEFKASLDAGINGFMNAGDIYVRAIDQDPEYADRLQEELKDIVPGRAWSQLEALGRKIIHPKLILGGLSDPRKTNVIKRLPYSLQNRVFKEEKFPLLISGGDILDVSLLKASYDQTIQICGEGQIRSPAEQKAYIESNKLKEELRPQDLPYYFSKGKIIFRKNTQLTRAELKQLVAQL
tara:strand:- start:2633 stop:3208 length:576 start_codon:yes stop_codon:yes gene_type:complete